MAQPWFWWHQVSIANTGLALFRIVRPLNLKEKSCQHLPKSLTSLNLTSSLTGALVFAKPPMFSRMALSSRQPTGVASSRQTTQQHPQCWMRRTMPASPHTLGASHRPSRMSHQHPQYPQLKEPNQINPTVVTPALPWSA